MAVENWKPEPELCDERARLTRREQRYGRYQQVIALYEQGLGFTEITRRVGLSRRTMMVHISQHFSNFPRLPMRRSSLMPKRKRFHRPLDHTYCEQQLAGMRAHSQTQKQSTMERLRSAITSLQAQHKPISARTIREECGLEYASIRRNPEALLLYQQHSMFL
jgi:hypothetical protein